jgi:protocatechuate 3,4-dioxygenase beta subunit
VSEHGSFSIRVVDEDGNGVSGARVAYQCGSISGVGTAYTDDDGWAVFEIVHGILDGEIPIQKIWVNGNEVSDETTYPQDGDTFSFTLP